jgi:hypothetical protein
VCTAIYCTFTGHGIVLKGMVWYYRSGDANGLTTEHTAHIFHNDPTALYFKASLPSGQIIGLAKWNLFATAGPHFPWPKEEFAEDANVELLAWIFWTVG